MSFIPRLLLFIAKHNPGAQDNDTRVLATFLKDLGRYTDFLPKLKGEALLHSLCDKNSFTDDELYDLTGLKADTIKEKVLRWQNLDALLEKTTPAVVTVEEEQPLLSQGPLYV